MGAQGEALREADSEGVTTSTSHAYWEDADCADWEYWVDSGGPGGGGSGPSWTCYLIDWYDVYDDGSVEYLGSTTECYEGYAE